MVRSLSARDIFFSMAFTARLCVIRLLKTIPLEHTPLKQRVWGRRVIRSESIQWPRRRLGQGDCTFRFRCGFDRSRIDFMPPRFNHFGMRRLYRLTEQWHEQLRVSPRRADTSCPPNVFLQDFFSCNSTNPMERLLGSGGFISWRMVLRMPTMAATCVDTLRSNFSICCASSLFEVSSSRMRTKARMISMLTAIARLLLRTVDSRPRPVR